MIKTVTILQPQGQYQHLTVCSVDGTPDEIQETFEATEAWLTAKAPDGWRWFAKDATEAGIKVGLEAHQQYASHPLVQSIQLTGVPFVFDIDRAEDAVLFKLWFENG